MKLKLALLGTAFFAFVGSETLNATATEKSPLEAHVLHLAGDIALSEQNPISIDDLLQKEGCAHWEDPNCH